MSDNIIYADFASIVSVFHTAYTLFIIIGFILIWAGYFAKWKWVRNYVFRLIHLAMMGFVGFEAVFNIECPLTWAEYRLLTLARIKHGSMPFIAGFVDKVLFYNFPVWLFNLIYFSFTILLIATWFIVRPEKTGGKKTGNP